MKHALLACTFLFVMVRASAQETVTAAKSLIGAKDYAGAKRMLESILRQDPSNHQARYVLGNILARPFAQYDEAEEQMEKAVELSPDSAEYQYALGNIYGIQAQNASVFSRLSYAGKVKDQWIKAVELRPKEIRYRRALMGYYVQAPGIAGGSIDKAREQASEIVKLDPYQGHLAMADVEDGDGENGKAEQEYRKAIELQPGGWRAYHALGYHYMRQKRWDDAIAQFRTYVEVAPKDANSHDSLGEALLAKGSADDALASYQKALAIDAAFPSSLLGAAKCYDRKGMKADAARFYRQYAAANPGTNGAKDARERADELEGK
jgi:Tfp pilus assembly protein PilF